MGIDWDDRDFLLYVYERTIEMNVLSSDKKSQTFILIGRRRKSKIRKHFYLGFVELNKKLGCTPAPPPSPSIGHLDRPTVRWPLYEYQNVNVIVMLCKYLAANWDTGDYK